jgi:uncharacterized protein
MLALLLALATTVALPAAPTRYVNDHAGVLSPGRADALDARLQQLERDTSSQLVVYVDRQLPPDTTIEELGAQAIHTWGVGQKGKDNGAILFVFTDAHKMRIEVGYGLEPTLTDAKCRSITSRVMKPLLQAGDAAGAIEQGTEAIAAVIRGSGFHGSGKTVAQKKEDTSFDARDYGFLFGIILVVAGIAGLVISLLRRGLSTARQNAGSATYDPPMPGPVVSTSSIFGSSSSSASSGSTSFDSPSSSSDSSSSDSSSSSDFSGGGGDGGGGGSSDSW